MKSCENVCLAYPKPIPLGSMRAYAGVVRSVGKRERWTQLLFGHARHVLVCDICDCGARLLNYTGCFRGPKTDSLLPTPKTALLQFRILFLFWGTKFLGRKGLSR